MPRVGFFFVKPYLCLSTHLVVVLSSFIVGSSSFSFQIFSEGNDPYVVVHLVCPWEEVSSEFAAILHLFPNNFLFF